MSHECHAHGCDVQVPPSMFMCRRHWYSLRKPLRDAIWREYRQGQERDKRPSTRYLAVQRRAVGELAFKPNDEAAANVAAAYLLESEAWRCVAVDRGECDPLERECSAPPIKAEERGELLKELVARFTDNVAAWRVRP